MTRAIRREVLTGAPDHRQANQRPELEPFLPVIRQILEDDDKAPTKLNHTAHRIFDRLRVEHGYTGGETVVKEALREYRISHREVLLPLPHRSGEAQMDFGEATVRIAGKETTAVIEVLKDRERKLAKQFLRLSSHHLSQARWLRSCEVGNEIVQLRTGAPETVPSEGGHLGR